MRILIAVLFINISVYAGAASGDDTWRSADNINVLFSSGTVSGDDTWRSTEVIDLGARSGTVSGDDTWRKFKELAHTGEFDFDSSTDRWVLKTRSRLLSVKNIDLVDKFHSKQSEVTSSKNKLEHILKEKFKVSTFEKKATRMIKFKNYELKDFDY